MAPEHFFRTEGWSTRRCGSQATPSFIRASIEPFGKLARLIEKMVGVMHTQTRTRLYFGCDLGELAALMLGICAVALVALSI